MRGGLRQLRLDHSQADIARAVLEGLTLAVVDCLDAAGPLERLALCGGGARSDTWSRMIADAAGVPVVRPTVSEVGACGAALQGVAAVGGTELAEVQDAGVRTGELLEPETQEHDRWRTRLEELRRARRDDRAG